MNAGMFVNPRLALYSASSSFTPGACVEIFPPQMCTVLVQVLCLFFIFFVKAWPKGKVMLLLTWWIDGPDPILCALSALSRQRRRTTLTRKRRSKQQMVTPIHTRTHTDSSLCPPSVYYAGQERATRVYAEILSIRPLTLTKSNNNNAEEKKPDITLMFAHPFALWLFNLLIFSPTFFLPPSFLLSFFSFFARSPISHIQFSTLTLIFVLPPFHLLSFQFLSL